MRGIMTFSKKSSILLIAFLLLVVFVGGYRHFCLYDSHACDIRSQADNQPFLFLAPANAAGRFQPLHATSDVFLPLGLFSDPLSVFTPPGERVPSPQSVKRLLFAGFNG
jgi:hypothetical protein